MYPTLVKIETQHGDQEAYLVPNIPLLIFQDLEAYNTTSCVVLLWLNVRCSIVRYQLMSCSLSFFLLFIPSYLVLFRPCS